QAAAFTFQNESSRSFAVEYAPVLPEGFDALTGVRRVVAPARGVGRDAFSLLPVRLGAQSWPMLPARLLGPLGLAWWSRELRPSGSISVAPDTLFVGAAQPRGNPSG